MSFENIIIMTFTLFFFGGMGLMFVEMVERIGAKKKI